MTYGIQQHKHFLLDVFFGIGNLISKGFPMSHELLERGSFVGETMFLLVIQILTEEVPLIPILTNDFVGMGQVPMLLIFNVFSYE